MHNTKKTSREVIFYLFLLLFISCGSSNPVDKQLNKLENVIEKYERQAKKNKLTEADVEKMQAELLSIGIKAPGNVTKTQEERFFQLDERMDRLEAAASQE